MGFKGWFMGDNTGKSYAVKVMCTNCSRVIVVKISQGKTFEKWSKRAKCGNCDTTDSWKRTD